MDDDLMSLRSSASSKNDDDLLGGFGGPPDTGQPGGWTDTGGTPNLDFGSIDDQPEWLRDLEPQPEVAAPAKSTTEKKKVVKKLSKKERASSPGKLGGNFLGMTPLQRMILSLGLFLMVTLIGVLLLVAIGAFNVP